jgi:hypothetical protein
MKGQWTTDVVDHLCVLKRQGVGFDDAWNQAMIAHRPTRRDRDGGAASLYAFHHRACADAWYGRRPKLQYFSLSI